MFKMKKDEQNGNILCLRDIIRFRIMFTIFKFLYPTRIKWERKKRCTLPKPSGSEKSGVPYQNQVGAKKAVYPTKQKWERKKKVVNSILG